MDGFVLSYDSVGDVNDKGAAIMECFSPEKVPVISQLATEFGVFDHWYSSSMIVDSLPFLSSSFLSLFTFT